MNSRSRARSRGISTTEILVGSALSLVTLATLFAAFHGQERALATQNAYVETQAATRNVVDLLAREVRMAAYDPSGTALTVAPGPNCPGARQGITEATTSRLHFRQDLNGDGVLTAAGEDVTYDVVSGQLRRTDGTGAAVVLATGITDSNFGFRYFTSDNPPVELVPSGTPAALTSGQRDCVAEVQVTMQATQAAGLHSTTRLRAMATSRIGIRNRTLNNL